VLVGPMADRPGVGEGEGAHRVPAPGTAGGMAGRLWDIAAGWGASLPAGLAPHSPVGVLADAVIGGLGDWSGEFREEGIACRIVHRGQDRDGVVLFGSPVWMKA
jgi:hypothetical protein